MTSPSPEERARALLQKLDMTLDGELIDRIASTIREAVEAETEACAMVVDAVMQPELDAFWRFGDKKPSLFAAKIRNAIRSRLKKP